MTGWVENPPLPPPGGLPQGGQGGDIWILWDNTQGLGDWGLAVGDVLTGQDLETACLTSLFSDALATPDFIPTDGTTDRRGWWADTYLDIPLGSNLWQLDRSKTTRAALGTARAYAQNALNWLILDGVAAEITVNATWLSTTMIGLAIAITEPNGTETRFMFAWVWANLAGLASPVYFPNPFPPAPTPQRIRRTRRAVR
jgi:phage gp46-like protein